MTPIRNKNNSNRESPAEIVDIKNHNSFPGLLRTRLRVVKSRFDDAPHSLEDAPDGAHREIPVLGLVQKVHDSFCCRALRWNVQLGGELFTWGTFEQRVLVPWRPLLHGSSVVRSSRASSGGSWKLRLPRRQPQEMRLRWPSMAC